MSDPNFDPYHQWLGIPPKHQPPNHYRLLGLELFESDHDVIDSAAMRQITHIRSFALGQYGDVSQSILNEIAESRLTLLRPEQKKVYDEKLRKMIGQDAANPSPDSTSIRTGDAGPSPVAEDTQDVRPFDAFTQSSFATEQPHIAVQKKSVAGTSQKKKSSVSWALVISVAMGGIGLAIVLLWVVFKNDSAEIVVADTKVQQSAQPPTRPNQPVDRKSQRVPNTIANQGNDDDSLKVKQDTQTPAAPTIAPFDAAKEEEHTDTDLSLIHICRCRRAI